MKCIKSNADGKITRVPDDIAAMRVRHGFHTFSSKEAFKLQENPNYKKTENLNTTSKLQKRKTDAEFARRSRLGLN